MRKTDNGEDPKLACESNTERIYRLPNRGQNEKNTRLLRQYEESEKQIIDTTQNQKPNQKRFTTQTMSF